MPLTALQNEVVPHCLDAADLRMIQEDSDEACRIMKVTFTQAGSLVASYKLNGDEIVRLFLKPMKAGLAERHAIDDACQLYYDFFDAFWFQARGGSFPRTRSTPLQAGSRSSRSPRIS